MVVLGVNALARETGLPRQTISDRMRKGATAADVRRYAALREGRSPQPTPAAVAQRREAPKSTVPRPECDALLQARDRLSAIGDARLRRTRALAEKLELENQQLRSQLVPTAYLREWSRRFLAYTRGALFKVSELREVLAVESDPVKCIQILQSWVERTLAHFYQMDELWGPTSKLE
jgi:hypothetical protein